MKTLMLHAVALVATTSAAFAADLPSRRVPPAYVPPIPVFSWTGFYLGGQIGFAFGQDRGAVVGPPGRINMGSARPNGIIGGGHVGYNFAFPGLTSLGPLGGGGIVVGAEADIDGTDYRDVINVTTLRNQVQGSARGRLGFAADRALFYATGGASFAQFQTTYALPAAQGGFQSLANTRVGWTVGGGVEYAITTQWSLRAEYRYADYGTYRQLVGNIPQQVTRREIMQRAQVGFSYKFDTAAAAPVVARY